jgi:limonene 1,2-monooxygenase
MRKTKLRAGVFVAPFHPLDESPTLCLRRDLELAEWADRIGFSEFWFGEHHSAGYEIISSPELMIAAAAERTQRIRLGTGVVSLPYHNPLMVANRILQLDHMTRGRVIFGAGPGLLVSDGHMLSLDVRESRDKLEQGLRLLLRLFRGEWVTEETGWYRLQDAHCQLLPYSEPHPEVCVASTFSPNGGRLAGSLGAGMLCLAATQRFGFDALSTNWKIAEETAAQHGRTMAPQSLRCATDIYIAETRDAAIDQVRAGFARANRYYVNQAGPAATEDMLAPDALERQIASGEAIVGTPDDAIAQIRRLEEKVPDFGCLLLLERNWASLENTKRSYEMLARYVLPAINGDNANRIRSFQWAGENAGPFVERFSQATRRAFEKHQRGG